MKVAIISITGNNALGARYVVSAIRQAGHECHLILFKLFKSKVVSRKDKKYLRYIEYFKKQTGIDIVFRYTYSGNDYLPHPEKVTKKEINLFLELIEQNNYDVIGFSLLAPNIPTAIQLTQAIKTNFPDKKVIWGGIEPTLSPEIGIQYADAVLRGEGEEAFVEYLSNPENYNIKGFWFKTEDGTIIKNPLRPLIQDLDKLPFPSYGIDEYIIDDNQIRYDLMNNPTFYRDCFIIISSRGCPYKCSYCVHSKMRKLYQGQPYLRRRSVDNFIQELKEIMQRFDFSDLPFFFYDEIFAWDEKWIEEFSIKYRQQIGHPFYCYCHVKFSNRNIMTLLRDAGLIAPCTGVQSGSKYILREIYHRPVIKKEEYINFFTMVLELGFKIYEMDIMIGSPFEREEDLQATFELLLSLPKPFTIHLIHIVTFPNTVMAELPEEKKVNLPEKVFYFWAMLYHLTQFSEISSENLRKLSKDTYLKKHPEILDEIMSALYRLHPVIMKFWGFEEKGYSSNKIVKELLPAQNPYLKRVSLIPFKRKIIRLFTKIFRRRIQ